MMNKRIKSLLPYSFLAACFFIFNVSVSHADCLQPVYIIAHRCNGAGDVSAVVTQQGVNAIEADFTQDTDGRWFVEHDFINYFSTFIEDWLPDVANAIAESDTLALVIFDIKTPEGNLLSLYRQARRSLGPEINLIFSIGDFFPAFWAFSQDQFKDALNQDPRAGAAMDYLVGGETQGLVQDLFRIVGITDYWFADGISAAVSTPASVVRNVKVGFILRHLSLLACEDRFHGVYTWTYEQDASIKDWLVKTDLEYPLYNTADPFQTAGVNGIFMNAAECFGRIDPHGAWDPKDAVTYAKTFQLLTGTRFANRVDNPFEVPAPGITCPPSTTVECSAPEGTSRDDPQLDAFFDGVTITSRGCDAVGDAEVAAPEFFYLNEPASVVFTAIDESQCRPSNSCMAEVTVTDTTAPTIMNITATPDVLWPPNGKMVPVTVDVATADICDTAPFCQITSVTSNEPEEQPRRGNHSPDWSIAAGLELRAERSGAGDGRIYTITVECADASGNSAQGAVEVGVPHDRK